MLFRPVTDSQSTATKSSMVAKSAYSDDALPGQLQIIQPAVSKVASGSQHEHPKSHIQTASHGGFPSCSIL